MVADAEELAGRLAPANAATVRDAAHDFRTETDADYYADNVRLLEPAYLRGTTPQAGSDRIEVATPSTTCLPTGVASPSCTCCSTRVPRPRRADLVRHPLSALVEPGGRLLVSHYRSEGGTDRGANTVWLQA
ncbi:MAG: hypothetical protein ACRDSK_26065 [Actinophytocola sp.]|uniref:hypothetical protein n=1 Tax=Actinophytocola sp. TaxID=1872138 RepID=UPI003D6A8830